MKPTFVGHPGPLGVVVGRAVTSVLLLLPAVLVTVVAARHPGPTAPLPRRA